MAELSAAELDKAIQDHHSFDLGKGKIVKLMQLCPVCFKDSIGSKYWDKVHCSDNCQCHGLGIVPNGNGENLINFLRFLPMLDIKI